MRVGMALAILVTMLSGTNAFARVRDYAQASKRFFIENDGGGVEVRANDAKDKRVRDTIRTGLHEEAQDRSAFLSAAIKEHQKEITLHFEKTDSGGRIRVTAKSGDALRAIHDYLRSQMDRKLSKAVTFSFISDTALIAVPVIVNGQGPYKFLLDTGASNTILSLRVAEALGVPAGRPYTLASAGGDIHVTVRQIETLEIGEARLEKIDIAVANFGLLDSQEVDGILGGDFLRRFTISIDYEKRTVQIQSVVDSTSMLVA